MGREARTTVRVRLLSTAVLVGTANGGDPGARGRESRHVLLELAVGARGLGRTSARVTGRDEEGNTTGTKLHEEVTDGVHVVGGDGALIITVRGGDGLGNGVQLDHVLEPVEVGLVGVLGASGEVGGGSAASRVVDVGDGVGQRNSDLDVEISLAFTTGASATVVDADNGGGGIRGDVGGILLEEGGEVIGAVDLLEVASNTDGGLVGWSVAIDVVVVAEAVSSAGALAARVGLGGIGSTALLGGLGSVLEGLVAVVGVGEEGGRLDHGNGAVEVAGQAVLGGTDSLAARLVLVDGVVGVKELLGLVNAHGDGEVTGLDLAGVDSVAGEPLGDGLNGLLGGSNEGIDLLLGQVLAVVGVVGGADVKGALAKSIEVLLTETDVKVNLVLSRGSSLELPSRGDSSKGLLGDHLAHGRGSGQGGHEEGQEGVDESHGDRGELEGGEG